MKLKNALGLAALLAVSNLAAEPQDKWGFSLGSMFVTNFETDMQIGKKGFPLGAKINTKDQLGMESETAVFRADGYYRFTDTHAIELSYYAVRSQGSRYVENEFEWNGDILSEVQAHSTFDMTVYEVNYLYSFYHNPDVELALTAGLHITRLDASLTASGKVNDEPGKKVSSGGGVTAPLPVFGFQGEYTILPNTLFANYKAQYFFIEISDYKGGFVSSMLNLEYRFMDHYGAGVGFNSNRLMVEMDNGGTIVNVTNNLNGFMAYLSYTY